MSGAFTLLQAAAHFAAFEKNLEFAREGILYEWAAVVQKEAKRVLGTYDYGWQELAASTQSERESQGYEPDEPGLRSGAMRDSILGSVDAERGIARVGSNDDHLVYFELGTSRQPPRPVLAYAAAAKRNEIGRIARKYLRSAWTSAGANSEILHLLHAVKLLLEVAREIYHGVDKLAKKAPK